MRKFFVLPKNDDPILSETSVQLSQAPLLLYLFSHESVGRGILGKA